MQLEKKYFLSQAVASFTGSLILAPVVLQNISENGFSLFNGVSFGVVVLLLLNALALVSAACLKYSRLSQFARSVTSTWGWIPLIFFTYSWAMGVMKLITLYMVDWQVYIIAAIGLVLIIVNIIFLWERRGNTE